MLAGDYDGAESAFAGFVADLSRRPAHRRGPLLVGQDAQRPRRPRRRRQGLYRRHPRLAADRLGARRGGGAVALADGAEEARRRLPDPGRVRPALSQGAGRRRRPRRRRPHPGQVRGLEAVGPPAVLDRRLLPRRAARALAVGPLRRRRLPGPEPDRRRLGARRRARARDPHRRPRPAGRERGLDRGLRRHRRAARPAVPRPGLGGRQARDRPARRRPRAPATACWPRPRATPARASSCMGHTADDLAEAAADARAPAPPRPDPREWAPSPAWPEGRGRLPAAPAAGRRAARRCAPGSTAAARPGSRTPPTPTPATPAAARAWPAPGVRAAEPDAAAAGARRAGATEQARRHRRGPRRRSEPRRWRRSAAWSPWPRSAPAAASACRPAPRTLRAAEALARRRRRRRHPGRRADRGRRGRGAHLPRGRRGRARRPGGPRPAAWPAGGLGRTLRDRRRPAGPGGAPPAGPGARGCRADQQRRLRDLPAAARGGLPAIVGADGAVTCPAADRDARAWWATRLRAAAGLVQREPD